MALFTVPDPIRCNSIMLSRTDEVIAFELAEGSINGVISKVAPRAGVGLGLGIGVEIGACLAAMANEPVSKIWTLNWSLTITAVLSAEKRILLTC